VAKYVKIKIGPTTLVGVGANVPVDVLKKKLKANPDVYCRVLGLKWLWNPEVARHENGLLHIPAPSDIQRGGMDFHEKNMVAGTFTSGVNKDTGNFEITIDGSFIFSFLDPDEKDETLARIKGNIGLFPAYAELWSGDKESPKELKAKVDGSMRQVEIYFSQDSWHPSVSKPGTAVAVPFEIVGECDDSPRGTSTWPPIIC
jgi:hypothetical protein